ncbi:MAG: hypothetical protein HC881_09975 [Leptolyngbyaceae cyanobacterium SL_7_1]|nr:hypothetical protein [Leptolyngbyaceae cyanobacterium SL_7_1]
MAAISALKGTRFNWQTVTAATLGFWLSCSLMLDCIIMPGMYVSGMMTQPGFATAGYSIFWLFNRIELLCAAGVLTGVLALANTHERFARRRWTIALSLLLVAIPVLYTYTLTPMMGALGLQLDWFTADQAIAPAMSQMHNSYWALELTKLAAGLGMLGFLANFVTES